MNTDFYTKHDREKTVKVKIGNNFIGGDSEILIQSMCNTSFDDVDAGFRQAHELALAGAKLVRFAVRNTADVENLKQIKTKLRNVNINIPLSADVHFNPEAAFAAALAVEKVRINPGNFIDKRAQFVNKKYTEQEWDNELRHIEDLFLKFLKICKENHVAVRIGVNQGSLSDRIMSRYGNTVEGMVESAMEYIRLCQKHNFLNVIVSLKSSNVREMISANRMFAEKAQKENLNYPLHLGVTEAGDGVAGRVKSAVGIGTLLAEGIGGTIRVSLTENPVNEITAAQKLANYYRFKENPSVCIPKNMFDPYNYAFYTSNSIGNIGGQYNPIVICDVRSEKSIDILLLNRLGYKKQTGKWIADNRAPDVIFIGQAKINVEIPEKLNVVYEYERTLVANTNATPLLTKQDYMYADSQTKNNCKWVTLTCNDLYNTDILNILRADNKVVIVLETRNTDGLADQRAAFIHLKKEEIKAPIIIKRDYVTDDWETYTVQSSADIGGLQINGMGSGIWITNPFLPDPVKSCEIMFEILQASRTRTSQTEYIACPSCGRTQFDIISTLKQVRERTLHLTHLKIGVMGCIVNGPGEMADADYGYVGAAPGKVMLYKGKNLIRKNIPSEQAIDELISIIKENREWTEPCS